MAARYRPTATDRILDSELRDELISFGLSVGPITKTTRVILIKKLNHLRAAARKKKKLEKAKSKNDHGKFFSSDESESDQASSLSPVTSRSKINRRGSNSIPTRTTAEAANTLNNVDGTPSTRTRRTSNRSQFHDSLYTTNTLADKKVAKNYALRTSVSSSSKDKRKLVERYSDCDEDDLTATTTQVNTTPSPTKMQYANFSLNTSELLPDSSLKSSCGSNSRLSNTSTSRKRFHKSLSGKLNRSVTSILDGSVLQPPISKQTSMVQMPSLHMSGNHNSVETEARLQREFALANKNIDHINWLNYVPIVLKTTAFIFLIILASSYLMMRFSNLHNCGSRNDQNFIPLCVDGNKTVELCLDTQEEINDMIQLLNLLYNHLSLLAGNKLCGHDDKSNLTKQEVKVFIRENMVNTVNKTFDSSLELIVHNPEWKIRAYNSSGQLAQTVAAVVWLRSESPTIPLSCQIIRVINKVFFQILISIFVIMGVWTIYKVLQWKRYKEEELVRQKYDLVEKIIYTLENHARASREDKQLSPYLAIPHVRDMLIQPQDRRKNQHLWESAVTFLADNESRVRTESQVIAGENFAVWRWIGVTSPQHHRDIVGKKKRIWQGSALENVETALEKPNKETSCLQIKNMFDASIEFEPKWPASVEKALKEKCGGDSCGIVRVTVDKESSEGCVFVKCSSEKVAHKVYNSLHGSYLDGRLVSAKYISPEWYMELGLPDEDQSNIEQTCTIF